jgi:apolipoprotein N-acyltransferase
MRTVLRNILPLPLWAALSVGALSGVVLGMAFPSIGFWPLAFLGVFLCLWALVGRGFWTGTLVGLAAGGFFWGPLIFWLTLYLGPIPWLGLAGLETLFFALGCGLIALVLTRAPGAASQWGLRFWALPTVVAGLWVAREGIAAVWPYGGFAWGRVAQSQSESPYGALVAWVGTAGLSFIIVWISAFALEVIRARRVPDLGPVVVIALVLLAVVPRFPVATNGTLRIAAVQGNTKSGLFDHVSPGDNLIAHTQTTLTYVKPPVDLVVWPENASDIDPTQHSDSALVLNLLSKKYNAPFLVGTITNPSDGVYFNSSLVWQAGKGVVAQYDKIHPVPFAEYMPNRDFFHALVPDLVDLVTHDYSPGTRSNVITASGTKLGLSICFDIVDDQQLFEMIAGGAQVVIAQTNNADFGHSAESLQQLAIAKLRAIETGRSVVNISTVGVSAMVDFSGRTIASIPSHTRGAMTQNVALSDTITPAMVAGRSVEAFVSLLGFAGVAVCLVATRRTRRSRQDRVVSEGRTDVPRG